MTNLDHDRPFDGSSGALLSVTEAATLTGLSRKAIERRIDSGTLPVQHTETRRRLIQTSDLISLRLLNKDGQRAPERPNGRLTLGEAATRTGLTEGALGQRIRRGSLPAQTYGRRKLVSEAYLIERGLLPPGLPPQRPREANVAPATRLDARERERVIQRTGELADAIRELTATGQHELSVADDLLRVHRRYGSVMDSTTELRRSARWLRVATVKRAVQQGLSQTQIGHLFGVDRSLVSTLANKRHPAHVVEKHPVRVLLPGGQHPFLSRLSVVGIARCGGV